MITKEITQEIIEALQGSCDSIEQVCANHNVDPDLFLDQYCKDLDNAIFNCDSCGWWFDWGDSAESASGDLVCSNCAEDE